MTMKKQKEKRERDPITKFAREHKKEIMSWQNWARQQNGKTFSEMDWENEPKIEDEE